MSTVDPQGVVLPERYVRVQPGRGYDGSYGEGFEYSPGATLALGSGVCNLWQEEKRTKSGSDYHNYRRYGLETYDQFGTVLSSFDGDFLEDQAYLRLPREAIHDRVYVLAYTQSQNPSLSYAAHNSQGARVIPFTTIETVTNPKRLGAQAILRCGPNVMMIWEERWSTANGYDRKNMRYQVRDLNGNLVVPSTSLNPPLLPDGVNQHDEWFAFNFLVDNEGKVWISMEHSIPGPDEQYYLIIGADGSVWKPATRTPEWREFIHCDQGGYIWAREGNQVLLLNSNDTNVVPPRPASWVPSARVGQVSASVDGNGDEYRIYDRWSDAQVVIHAPLNAVPMQMELFNLDLWNNGLYVSDVALHLNGVAAGNFSGVLGNRQVVDVSGRIREGANLLTISQGDLHGGQVLVTFPCSAAADFDQNCSVGLSDYNQLRVCLAGPGVAAAPACNRLDLDSDDHVDLHDFALWENALTGP